MGLWLKTDQRKTWIYYQNIGTYVRNNKGFEKV